MYIHTFIHTYIHTCIQGEGGVLSSPELRSGSLGLGRTQGSTCARVCWSMPCLRAKVWTGMRLHSSEQHMNVLDDTPGGAVARTRCDVEQKPEQHAEGGSGDVSEARTSGTPVVDANSMGAFVAGAAMAGPRRAYRNACMHACACVRGRARACTHTCKHARTRTITSRVLLLAFSCS